MKKEVSYFQINFKGYIQGNSYVHKINARVKIISVLLIMGGCIFINKPLSIILLLLFVLTLVLFSNIKLSYIFSPIPPLIPFIAIAILFRLFTHNQKISLIGSVVWKWKIFIVTNESLIGSFVLLSRFLALFVLISLFSATTKLEDFTKGIEHILRPLQRIGLPANEFSMVINIAISFLHVLFTEMNRIVKAQVSRGADFEVKRYNLIKRLKNLIPLIVPLFTFSLEHSKYLVEAMEARCYRGGRGRSYYSINKYNKRDYLFVAITVFITALSVYIGRLIEIKDILDWVL